MSILYAISAANLFLLLWIAVALSRHIRRFAESEERAAEKREAAGQAARPVRQMQEAQSAEFTLERRSSPRPAAPVADTPVAQPTLPYGDRRSRPDRRQTGGSLYADGYDGLYAPNRPGPVSVAPDLAQSRKVRYASTGRLDPAYFNKDAGDLTDPDAPVKARTDGSKPTRRY
jgi:hypothetical protein